MMDPIISLIDDQIDNLARYGIHRAIGITCQLTGGERERALKAFQSGHYIFGYIARAISNGPFPRGAARPHGSYANLNCSH